MAPTVQTQTTALFSRYYCDSIDRYGNCYTSHWHWWGRWVLLGVIILFALLFFVIIVCRQRQRRQRRQQSPQQLPLYGGWMGMRPYGRGQSQAANNPQPPYPPPQYSQQPIPPTYTGSSYGPTGYYAKPDENVAGGHNGQDAPLQPPAGAYYPNRAANNTDDDYAPPEGPPPAKR